MSAEEREQEQRARTQQAVVEMLAVVGSAALTVEQVVLHAGISRATFYDQFRNLEHAYTAVWRQVDQELVQPGAVALAQEPTPRAQLSAWFTDFLARIEATPHLALAAVSHRGSPGVEPSLEAGLRQLAEQWYLAARRSGMVGAVEPELAARWLVGLLLGSAELMLQRNGQVSAADVARQTAEAALAALR